MPALRRRIARLKYEEIRKAILFIPYALTGRHPKRFGGGRFCV
jgi:hypothetical protein